LGSARAFNLFIIVLVVVAIVLVDFIDLLDVLIELDKGNGCLIDLACLEQLKRRVSRKNF